MDNLIIPNPTKYEITYINGKGETTTRKIVPISQDKVSLTAYDYLRHGIRTFKKACITAITSVQ
jgi:predicted DNA-binding transcriptional regulator YafY